MNKRRYMHIKRNTVYFRRRVPGLSTKIAPVALSLGTTDQVLGHKWIERLSLEFDRMFDSFVFLMPALPETTIVRYFELCLTNCLNSLRRQVRFAKMSGRFHEGDEAKLGLLPLIYESFLEDGIRKNLPLKRVDPTWTRQMLELAMRLYVIEAAKMTSNAANEQLISQFSNVSELHVGSAEQIGQLREANIEAHLAAIRKIQKVDCTRDRIEPPAIAPPSGASGAAEQVLVSDPAPAQIENHQDEDTAAKNAVVFGPSVDCSTMSTIGAHFEQVKSTAYATDLTKWSTDLAEVFWRFETNAKLSDAVSAQRLSDLSRFMLITGISCATEIKQAHLTHWVDILNKFPVQFMRSTKDTAKTIDQVMMMARHLPESQVGLHPETIRRHIKSIELVLARAKSEGVPLAQLDLQTLKPRKLPKHRAFNRRASFRAAELQKLFQHTLWQGCASSQRRHLPGPCLPKDGKYWIPLILAYTGARRGEISGMLREDVTIIDDIPVLIIRSNRYRGIKGEAEDASDDAKLTRTVPIHSRLLELGFLEYANDQKNGLLFPDVVPVPKSGGLRDVKGADNATTVDKFGGRFDHEWRKAMEITLDGNPRKLCIHSLRHFVNETLLHNPAVKSSTRMDLIGHVDHDGDKSVSITTYRDETPLSIKQAAIECLPRLL